MADFATFDPNRVVVSFYGVPVQGLTGDMVKLAFDGPAFTVQKGRQGDVTRIRMRDRIARVTVTVLPSSPTNDLLSALHRRDLAFGTGYGPMLIEDLNGSTVAISEQAWIVTFPDATLAPDQVREWEFDCHDMDLMVGGSLVL